MQVGEALSWSVQASHLVPQLFMSLLERQVGAVDEPHAWNPDAQVTVQAVPLQEATPSDGGAGQGELLGQAVPQLAISLLGTQIGLATVPPQLWYPVSHSMPHTPPAEQVA